MPRCQLKFLKGWHRHNINTIYTEAIKNTSKILVEKAGDIPKTGVIITPITVLLVIIQVLSTVEWGPVLNVIIGSCCFEVHLHKSFGFLGNKNNVPLWSSGGFSC